MRAFVNLLNRLRSPEGVVPSPEDDKPDLSSLYQAARDAHTAYRLSLKEGVTADSRTAGQILSSSVTLNDVTALRIYAEFPELCDYRYKHLIMMMRRINYDRSEPLVITPEIIAAYKRAGELYDGPKATGDPNKPQFEPLGRATLQKYVVTNMDNADVILDFVEKRGLMNIEDLKALVLLGADAPALSDGAL